MNQEKKNDAFQNIEVNEELNETSQMSDESNVSQVMELLGQTENTDDMLGKTRPVDIQAIKDIAVEDSGVKDMAEKETKKKSKKNGKDKLGINWVFWICITIILIPCLLFGWILLSAMQDTGTPIVGNRFQGDLNPAIEEAQITTLHDKISALDGVEDCSVNLIVATMRVTVNAVDTLDQKEISALSEQVYQTVAEVLPIEKYFTLIDTQKQYDLEVNVYNDLTLEDDFIMYNLLKNSAMEKYILQDVSTPLNPELAQDLRDYVIEREKKKEEERQQQENAESSEDSTEEDEG